MLQNRSVSKMQCKEVSWLLLQNGDNHRCIIWQGCSGKFHLRDEGFLLPSFCRIPANVVSEFGIFQGGQGGWLPYFPLVSVSLFLFLSLHSTQVSTHLCTHTLVVKKQVPSWYSFPPPPWKGQKRINYLYIYIYIWHILVYICMKLLKTVDFL